MDKKEKHPSTGTDIQKFAKRARSILWRLETGTTKPTYDRWEACVKKLREEDGLKFNEAIVQASQDFSCLSLLFDEYNVDRWKKPVQEDKRVKPEKEGIINEGIEQSYRDDLRWAQGAAGTQLRTRENPKTCPNDRAYYLYHQAIEDPKDFLNKVGQMETKVDKDAESRSDTIKAAKRTVQELHDYLAELDSEEEEREEEDG